MALIRGANGIVVDVPESIASGLVRSGGCEYVTPEPPAKPQPAQKTEAKPAPKRRGRPRKNPLPTE